MAKVEGHTKVEIVAIDASNCLISALESMLDKNITKLSFLKAENYHNWPITVNISENLIKAINNSQNLKEVTFVGRFSRNC